MKCSSDVTNRPTQSSLETPNGHGPSHFSERSQLSFSALSGDDVIDTSDMDNHDLRNYMYRLLKRADEPDERMSVLLVSFGFKYGIPLECDVMMDVRFIPNPFYNPLCAVVRLG